MADRLPWDIALQLPWHVLQSPAKKWAEQPSFVLGEYLFIACAATLFVHALSQGEKRTQYLLAWIGALVAGTANDLLFMALPLVDNFWQAQATIMLTPRLPLYIPCVYICFLYTPLVSVWRLNLPPLARAALTGLAASLFYAPYDIVGAKFLWWTWHNSDQSIMHRILGAPIGSTMWVVTFGAAFSALLNRVLDKKKEPQVSAKTFAKALGLVAACSSLLMMVQVTVLQQLDHGVPGIHGLTVLVIVFALLAIFGGRRAVPSARQPADRVLHAAVVVYFLTLVVIGASFDPATNRSTSLHQTYGKCHVQVTDITGHSRYQFLCAKDLDEDFSFACVQGLPAEGTDWYTVCGRPHRNFPRFLFGLVMLAALGIGLYSYMLGAFRRRQVAAI